MQCYYITHKNATNKPVIMQPRLGHGTLLKQNQPDAGFLSFEGFQPYIPRPIFAKFDSCQFHED